MKVVLVFAAIRIAIVSSLVVDLPFHTTQSRLVLERIPNMDVTVWYVDMDLQ